MNIIAALLVFTVIVIIHELGHFLLAKKNGIGVPEFSVGMGPRLITFAKTKEGPALVFFCSQRLFEGREDWQDVTKYSWKLFPIGGSCAMVGEDEDNDAEDSFNSKGVWARFSVVFAGPFFNFLLAFVLAVIVCGRAGIDYPIVAAVYENQPADRAGIQVGDEITSINGRKIYFGAEVDNYLLLNTTKGKHVKIGYKRDGEEHLVTLDPKFRRYLFGFSYANGKQSSSEIKGITEGGVFDRNGIKVGDLICAVDGTEVSSADELAKAMEKYTNVTEVTFLIEHDGEKKEYHVTPELSDSETFGMFTQVSYTEHNGKKNSALDVLKYGALEVKYWIDTVIGSLKQLVLGNISTKEMSGPVGIVDGIGEAIDMTNEQSKSLGVGAGEALENVILVLVNMCVLLSANLGVMNLLPLPALDGGRLVFILIEAIRGKPIDREKEGFVHFGGFIVLMLFMVFVMYNDIVRIMH